MLEMKGLRGIAPVPLDERLLMYTGRVIAVWTVQGNHSPHASFLERQPWRNIGRWARHRDADISRVSTDVGAERCRWAGKTTKFRLTLRHPLSRALRWHRERSTERPLAEHARGVVVLALRPTGFGADLSGPRGGGLATYRVQLGACRAHSCLEGELRQHSVLTPGARHAAWAG